MSGLTGDHPRNGQLCLALLSVRGDETVAELTVPSPQYHYFLSAPAQRRAGAPAEF